MSFLLHVYIRFFLRLAVVPLLVVLWFERIFACGFSLIQFLTLPMALMSVVHNQPCSTDIHGLMYF